MVNFKQNGRMDFMPVGPRLLPLRVMTDRGRDYAEHDQIFGVRSEME